MAESAMERRTPAVDRYFSEHFGDRWGRDEKTLSRYSTDMSMFRIAPLAVLFPRDIDDVIRAVRFARDEQIPITARCGGSGTAGGAIGRGILLVFDGRNGFSGIGAPRREEPGTPGDAGVVFHCDAGVRHTAFQAELGRHGYFLPSDPSSGPLSFIGGNIATKASGPHELRHGAIDRYIRSVRFVTADGAFVDTADPSTIPSPLLDAVRTLSTTLHADPESAAVLRRRKGTKIASGYNLFSFVEDSKLPDAAHITQLLTGSVGTLGVITGGSIAGTKAEWGRVLLVAAFASLQAAAEAIDELRAAGAAAIEILNETCLDILRERNPDLELPGPGASMVMAEFSGEKGEEEMHEAQGMLGARTGSLRALDLRVARTDDEQARLWNARKQLMLIVKNYGPSRKALSVVNDVGVPREHLVEFITFAKDFFEQLGIPAPIFGHGGSGNLHLRPIFNTAAPDLARTVQSVADAIYGRVLALGGTVTAEHGMGRLRAPYLEREWGTTLYRYMRDVKRAFDPDDILNPECMFADRAFMDDFWP